MRSVSSDKRSTDRMHILSLEVTFQETPMIGACIMNVLEEWEPENIYKKVAITALNVLQLTFWPHLHGEDP